MTTCANPDHSELEYYIIAVYPCSYINGQTARSQVAAPSEVIDATAYNALIQQGFRRSGPFVYRPRCDLCQAYQSMRLNVRNFVANRSQKRAWLKHAGLKAAVMAPSFRDEHYLLYSRYQEARHADGGMNLDDAGQYVDFLVSTNVASMMVEFRQPLPGNDLGELKMVSIIDQLDALMAT